MTSALGKCFKTIARVIDKMSLVMGYLAGLWVVGMTLALFYSVVSRRVFNRPLIWDVDFAEIAMVIMVYLGVAYTTQVDGHVAMDAVFMRLSPKGQNRVLVFVDLVMVVFAAIALWLGWGTAGGHMHSLTQAATLPQAPGYVMIPIGLALLLLQALTMLGRHVASLFQSKEAPLPSAQASEAH